MSPTDHTPRFARAPGGLTSRTAPREPGAEVLAASDVLAWLDGRARDCGESALLLLRLRQADGAAQVALARALRRAVRSADRVAPIGAASVAAWLDGIPPAAVAQRAERLRLALLRQGVAEFDVAWLAVGPGERRDAAALLAAALEAVGSPERHSS